MEFQCKECGACCSNFLPLTKKELHELKSWAQEYQYKPEPLTDYLEVSCPFLNPTTHRCVCYEHRPEVCRKYVCEAQEVPIVFSKKPKKYRVVNLREELFGEETISLRDLQAIRDYIKQRLETAVKEHVDK